MKKTFLAIIALLVLQIPAGAEAKKKSTHKKAHAKGKPTYYYNNSDGTLSQGKTDEQRPSAYKGDRVPENDGVKKNAQRNLNYNNGQALPANNGK